MDVSTYLPLLTGDTRATVSEQLAQRAEVAAAELKQQQQPRSGSDKALLKLLRRQMAARQVEGGLLIFRPACCNYTGQVLCCTPYTI